VPQNHARKSLHLEIAQGGALVHGEIAYLCLREFDIRQRLRDSDRRQS